MQRPHALLFALLLAATEAPGQTMPPHQVEVIGVAPLPGLGLPRDQVPANVQTADADDLARRQAGDLSSFLGRQMGSVHLNELQGNPFQPDLNFRGFTASPLLGTAQGLSVYLDGVRLNQPFGDVVSWDLIPQSAIATVTLMPGANPLFGLNTLGGALAVQTKDGLKYPGQALQLQAGAHGRAALGFDSGGRRDDGLHWFVTGNRLHERGWRVDSSSDLGQLFGKLGWQRADTQLTLSAALAETDLSGNGLQEQRLLARQRDSIYSKPDTTHNRAMLLSLALTRHWGDGSSFTSQVYWRRLNTRSVNGDVNEESLGQSLHQPNANERAALAAAGYSGFPAAGESAANTAFPRWRCLAQVLLQDEPAEKCNGLINRSASRQHNLGWSGQWQGTQRLGGLSHRWLAGIAVDTSRVSFSQGTELGTLAADHGVIGTGAFGDGMGGGDIDGQPYDVRVALSARSRTWSLFASDTLTLARGLHLTLSGRYNRNSVRSHDAIHPGGGAGSLDGEHRFSRFNPALGLSFAATPRLTAYAGVNQGSRSPSAIELGCADPANPCKLPNAMAGDPPLKAVVTTSAEAGLRGGDSALRWNLGLFHAVNRDDILFVADNVAGYGYFRNFGKTRRQGLEAGLSARLASGLRWGANLTWLDATFRSHETLNGAGNSSNDQALAGSPGLEGTIVVLPGHQIPLIPRQLFKAFADLPLGATLSAGADLVAVGGSYARGNENNAHQADGLYYLGPGRSAGYAVLNLNGEWRPAPGWRVFVQVNNLFDRRFSSAAQLGHTAFDGQGNFVAQPFAATAQGDRPLLGSTFFAPGAPRSVALGLRLSFD